jgi:hypothetical protein
MHPTTLAKRKALALNQIVFSAGALARIADLDPALIQGLNPAHARDAHVRDMFVMEGIAHLLTALGVSAGAIKEEAPVTVETPAPPITPPMEPTTTDDIQTPAPTPDSFEGLPEPVIGAAEDPEAETTPAVEDEPTPIEEEAPVAKPKRRTSSRKKS